jgi:hypothetical protein
MGTITPEASTWILNLLLDLANPFLYRGLFLLPFFKNSPLLSPL